MAELKIHPTAARFPQLDDERLNELIASIKANGLRVPIVLTWDGKTLVEGINRHRACLAAGVKPTFRKLPKSYGEADLINFIIDSNLNRRDLNPGQRAMLTLECGEDLEKAAKERQREGGKLGGKLAGRGRPKKGVARQQAKPKPKAVARDIAKRARTGRSTVNYAKKVRETSPVLAAQVSAGTTNVKDAYRQAMAADQRAREAESGGISAGKTTIVRTHDGEERAYPLPKAKPHFNFTNDQVSWAAWTTNPVTGCLHNCPYCYAREGIEVNENLKKHYPFGFKPTFFEYRLAAFANSKLPANWRDDPRLGRVFVSSMGDLFGNWVPDDWIEKVFAACSSAPWWEYLFLTKFPQRYVGLDLPTTAWIGTTVDQQYRVKIAEEAFRKISGVRLKWLSCEPLLEPLQFSDLSMFDFVVIGSQSSTEQPDGKGGATRISEFAPPFEWVADLTEKAHRAGCKVYQKPNLLGVVDPQHAGMKLIQDVPDLPDLPSRLAQGELKLDAAE